ncbi:Z1 domain-containing protein [Fibrella aquatica]|uniref:Z1 domain-containing protein n=1 Tax=Fibrella aquatica TaxID=3242487 RepID=UPI0035211621
MERIEPFQTAPIQWSPVVGQETLDLLRFKGFADSSGMLSVAGQMIEQEAVRIMASCGNPSSPENRETGLVLGYVQSGKTLSFTTLTALARDNAYQIVIIIAGTSTPLLEQSTDRIRKDLRLDDRTDRKWIPLKNPGEIEDKNAIRNAIRQWADNTYDRTNCRTILITVMKHGLRLANLTRILSELELSHVPILIIDDEGDQASMNTRARAAARSNVHISESEWSTIYARINELRDVLPHHTYLQYTATPQAPLFINVMDRLSPNFIKLLTPGDDYTGGITFFIQHPNLVSPIPSSDIGTQSAPLQEAPDSLKEALRIFFIGVAAGMKSGSRGNRSMMVHPSRLQGDHSRYFGFVNMIVASWRRLLTSLSTDDEDDKLSLLYEFRQAHRTLMLSVDDIPSFDDLSASSLRHAIEYTRIIEVNSSRGNTPQIPWRDEYGFILVGGQAMDRGFTVEGLTVTYMPRGIGTGNVDTIQQRARFFGYKRKYLGYCRVYVDQPTINSYQAIVEHEEDIRHRLSNFDVNNLHLNDWHRRAVLNEMLNLTRKNILYDELERHSFGDEWFTIKAPHDTERYIGINRSVLSDYISPLRSEFRLDEGNDLRTIDQRHLTATLPLQDCLNLFLNELKFTRERDSALFTSFKSIMKMQLEQNLDEPCQVYLMSTQTTDVQRWEPRERRLNNKDELQNLFQGKNPRTGPVIYPGDSEIKQLDIISIQVHLLSIKDTSYDQIPTIAIWVPDRMSRSIISQIPTLI